MFTEKNLASSLNALELPGDVDLFQQLHEAYSQKGRYYHDTTHIAECLKHFQPLRHLAVHPAEIELAFWFHDAIYDTKAMDNEERSAHWAHEYLCRAGASAMSAERIHKMIMATRDHRVSDRDTELMVDIDLGILGAHTEVFEQYDRAIRKEYQWVSEIEYRQGRLQVLRLFQERKVIYHTREIRSRLEQRARKNLESKITELGKF